MLWSEAAPMRTLLRRLLMAWIALSLLALAYGWWAGRWAGMLWLGAGTIVIPAAAVQAFCFTGAALDIFTLPTLALAAALAIAIGAVQWEVPIRTRLFILLSTALCASAVVIAVSFSGSTLAAYFAAPARTFALALTAGVAAGMIVPQLSNRRKRSVRRGRDLRRLLRDPGSLLLTVGSAVYILFTLFSGALDPRAGNISSESGRLFIRASLAEGSSIEETEAFVQSLERRMRPLPFIRTTRALLRPASAQLTVELKQEWTGRAELERAASRLSDLLSGGGGRISINTASAGGSIRLTDDFNERASRDEESINYRIILRAPDPEALREAVIRIEQRFVSNPIVDAWPESAPPSIRIDLSPRQSTRPERLNELARALRHSSTPPFPIADIAAGRRIFVIDAATPASSAAVPQEGDLLNRALPSTSGPIVPFAEVTARRRLIASWVARESGRFFIPVRFTTGGVDRESRAATQKKLEQSLIAMPLPTGVEIERPSLASWSLTQEKLRLYLLIALLPLLLATVAVFLMNSTSGLLMMSVPTAGVAAAAPWVMAHSGGADETTLFAIAASLAGTFPIVLHLSHGSRSAAQGYRDARKAFAPLLAAAVPLLIVFIAAAVAIDEGTNVWAVPLASGALAAGVAILLTIALPTATFRATAALRRMRSPEFAELQSPPSWSADSQRAHLQVRSVTKSYLTGFRALSDIGFELEPGIVGLLGPNGAGKTTLLRILTGLLTPTRGQVIFNGVPVTEANLLNYRRYIGFLPQEFNAYPGFTARQFLEYWALERGMHDARQRKDEIETLISAVGLDEHADRRVRDFSGGMRQRVGIARSLLGSPPVLVVDEPTTGLDIESRNRFRGLLLALAAHRIVILSTHLAGDVEATANRLLLLHRGRLRFDGPPGVLIERARGRVFESVVSDREVREFSHSYRITARVRTLDGVRIRAVARIDQEILGSVVEPALEEAYLAEIDQADASGGQRTSRSRFAFLRGEEG